MAQMPLRAPHARETIRIVVADDHHLYRRGLKSVLGLEPDLEVVAEAVSCADAVQPCREFDADIVLLGHRNPGNTGIEACAAIAEALPRTKTLILTASDEEADLIAALRAGATGYLLKNTPTQQIVESIRLAHGGQSMVPSHMVTMLHTEPSRVHEKSPRDAVAARLTEREHDVLRLMARGLGNRQIAGQLSISQNTVKCHVHAIMTKLHFATRVAAVLYAVQHDLFGEQLVGARVSGGTPGP